MTRLLKVKVLLDLVISDLLLFIFAVLLVLLIIATTIGALSYQRWFPTFSGYLQSIDTVSTSSVPSESATSLASSTPNAP
jgi:hypothetical protein